MKKLLDAAKHRRRPPAEGVWALSKERAVLGAVRKRSAGTVSFTPGSVGLQTDADELVVPESLGSFVTGRPYRHSGLSLQEAVVAAVSVRLAAASARGGVAVRLTYRSGRTDTVTTRLPLLEVAADSADLFSPDLIELRFEVVAGGRPVGEPSPSAYTDPATGLIHLGSGDTVKVPIRLANSFEGPFTVRVTDPTTGVTHAELQMKTDYVD